MLLVLLVQCYEKRHQYLPTVRELLIGLKYLTGKKERVFHDGFLLEQGDDRGQDVSLQWVIQASQLPFLFLYLVHTLSEIVLLLIGQAHEWCKGINLLRRWDVGRNKGIEVLDAVLQRQGRIVVAATEFQHREHWRLNHQYPWADGLLPAEGQHLGSACYA